MYKVATIVLATVLLLLMISVIVCNHKLVKSLWESEDGVTSAATVGDCCKCCPDCTCQPTCECDDDVVCPCGADEAEKE